MVIFQCKILSAGPESWAVEIPEDSAYCFSPGEECTIALGEEEVTWTVPPSFYERTPPGQKRPLIVNSQVRDWLKTSGLTSPSGNLLLGYVGGNRIRLGTSTKEMKRYAQGDLERFYLDHFVRLLQLHPQKIMRGPNPPDFALVNNGVRVYIEITEFHSAAKDALGRDRRCVEQDWISIRKSLTHSLRNGPRNEISATICFKKLSVPKSRHHQQFVSEVLAFVNSKRSLIDDTEKSFCDFISGSLLAQYLREVQLHRVHGLWITLWDWNYNSASVGLSDQELMDCTRKKLPGRKPADATEFWLLIVSGSHLSQSIGPRPGLNRLKSTSQALTNSNYDKVFIYQYVHDTIFEFRRGSWSTIIKGH